MKSRTSVSLLAVFLAIAVIGPARADGADMPSEPAVRAAKDAEGVELPDGGDKEKKEKKSSRKKQDAGAEKKRPQFDEVVKDAEKIEGLFEVYEKDGRYLMAIKPDQLDKDYMASLTRETGVGEGFILATMVIGESPVRFVKVGENVQVLLRNTRFTAVDDEEIRRAVKRSFSDSLLGSSKIESEPHPKTQAVLVEMTPFFVTDVEGLEAFFVQFFQTPYSLDPKNSYVSRVKGFPANLEVEARAHFEGQKPLAFSNLPDARSFFVDYRYSLTELPDTEGYIPRIADDRVGHFLTLYQDFSDDRTDSPYVRYATRWDLRKKDPGAEMSVPVKPITFWLENSIPERHRQAVADGVLLWNTAFEKIGFKDAVVVKQQPDQSDWDPADARFSTVRWFMTTTGAFAIGPSRINPRTGEIFDADIGVADSIVRFTRLEYRQIVDPVGSLGALAREMTGGTGPPAIGGAWTGALAGDTSPRFGCTFSRGAAMQAAFGHSLLTARGMETGSPEEEQYVRDFLVHVMAHEVGHTLGLRHNFRASTIHPVDRLQDSALTHEGGLTGSVMDYTPVNIAPPGGRQGQHWQTTLGPYDHWAIEYAYTPFDGVESPEDELPHLQAIARKGTERGHAFGSHEDMWDPGTNMWDIGEDPLEYYDLRIRLARELWSRIPDHFAEEGEGYQDMRRAFTQGITEFIPAAVNVAKRVGGLRNYRDHVGDPQGRLPMEPVPADGQRAALEFLRSNLFASDAFDLPPDLLARLAPTRWWDFTFSLFLMPRMEYPLHNVVLSVQALVLDLLYDPVRLDRLVDMEMHFPDAEEPFTMLEMFDGVQQAVWSELYRTPAEEIDSFRRALQREHLHKVIALLVQPGAQVPEDATTLARANLVELRRKIDSAVKSSHLDPATRAHLDESSARIDTALEAQMLRITTRRPG